ncbi:unnamed protein product [Cuscuta campestris]|uniref:Uncharacterized protein n=1 Tax=Cuscuta campestris TaxID=132261 RepID=A0A484L2X4_9ASTE|nr:unnamed protein product [Cuscuta campestris]
MRKRSTATRKSCVQCCFSDAAVVLEESPYRKELHTYAASKVTGADEKLQDDRRSEGLRFLWTAIHQAPARLLALGDPEGN